LFINIYEYVTTYIGWPVGDKRVQKWVSFFEIYNDIENKHNNEKLELTNRDDVHKDSSADNDIDVDKSITIKIDTDVSTSNSDANAEVVSTEVARTDVVSNVQSNSKLFLKRIKEVAIALRAITAAEKVQNVDLFICIYLSALMKKSKYLYIKMFMDLCFT
jgi:hypothetical protein